MTAKHLATPILIIIFNRPDTTSLVLEAIRKVRPPRLYIAADGPRPGIESDVELCRQARNLSNSLDWDCEVITWYREDNFGPDRGVSTAISWFFENETEGIILEDDCFADDRFFWFCQESLQRFRDDNRVMHVCGSNLLGWNNDLYSYYFSRYASVRGWASWRRAWNLFGFEKSRYEAIRERGYFEEYFPSNREKLRWFRVFDGLALDPDNQGSWVKRWDFSRFIQSGLSIVPCDNLVAAVDSHSTRSQDVPDQSDEDCTFRHPPFVIRNLEADKHYYSTVLRGERVLIDSEPISRL